MLFITIAIAAIINAVLKHHHSDRVSEIDFTFGGILAVLILAVWAVATFVIRKGPRHALSDRD